MTKDTWEDIIKYGAYEELNWIAVDREGNLGIFSAIMHAPIPSKIKESYENYISLRQAIDLLSKSTSFILTTLENGDFSDWTSYAEKGLFAFDFQDIHRNTVKNQYDLIAKPLLPININDGTIPINLLNTLVRFNCSFSDGDLTTDLIQ